MGQLTTHVLDTMNGCPASGMAVALYRMQIGEPVLLRQVTLDANGRAATPLLEEGDFAVGRYRLVFEVAAYFRRRGVSLPEPPFIDAATIDFGIAEAGGHYHVPLLASPWAYSTYRGS